MAKASINFEKATQHSIAHNFRKEKKEPHYLLPKEHRLENEYWRNEKTAKELFDAELQKAERKGGRVPKFENSHWEGVLNLNREHTLEDVQRVAKHIEGKLNVTCTSIAIHRDEGHINERGIVQYNLHAHLNFQTYKDGKQNWRLEHVKKELPQLQTDVAKMLNMTRGKEKSNALHLKPKAFREAVKTLANENDLKAEIAELRATLKESGGKREDYAKLEQLNKDLKEQLKNKDLTIDDLQKQINAHKTLTNELKTQNNLLRKEIATKDEKINSRANMSDLYIKESESEVLQSVDSVLKHDTSFQTLYEKKGGLLPSYALKDVHVVNNAQGFKASILGVFNKLKEKFADLKERFERLSRDHDKLMYDHKDLKHKYENVNQDRWEANNKVARLERELKEAKAELQALKSTKVSRYEKEMRVNRDLEDYEGYRYKHDSEMTSESKEKRANIAQKESEIAHIEQKLDNAKEVSVSESMEHTKDALERLNERINGKDLLAKARQQKANVEQMKQGYNNKLNEIPKLPEEQEQKPKARKPFVRE